MRKRRESSPIEERCNPQRNKEDCEELKKSITLCENEFGHGIKLKMKDVDRLKSDEFSSDPLFTLFGKTRAAMTLPQENPKRLRYNRLFRDKVRNKKTIFSFLTFR